MAEEEIDNFDPTLKKKKRKKKPFDPSVLDGLESNETPAVPVEDESVERRDSLKDDDLDDDLNFSNMKKKKKKATFNMEELEDALDDGQGGEGDDDLDFNNMKKKKEKEEGHP